MSKTKFASVFEAHPRAEAIYVVRGIPFLKEEHAVQYAVRDLKLKEEDVELVKREEVVAALIEAKRAEESDEAKRKAEETAKIKAEEESKRKAEEEKTDQPAPGKGAAKGKSKPASE